jgi:integrase
MYVDGWAPLPKQSIMTTHTTSPSPESTYYLFWPDEKDMRRSGYASVAHVPCIFDGAWSYVGAASRYLRERALLEWSPGRGRGAVVISNRFPTKKSLTVYGEALCNFLEWAGARGFDWRSVNYRDHIVGGYQAEMVNGCWSAAGKPLSPATINLRVKEVCNFLQWASDNALRVSFEVLYAYKSMSANNAKSTYGHRRIEVVVRAGAVRKNPKSLRMPTDDELRRWHKSVLIEKGAVKALMCELIIQTGIRREEAVQWRVDTLPINRSDWNVQGGIVQVEICFGTKGQKYRVNERDEKGPSRIICVPLRLALALNDYLVTKWPQLRRKYVQSAPSDVEKRSRIRAGESRLFLSEYSGEPISSQALYQAWVGVTHLPFDGWSPHGGRHYWACKTLLIEMNRRSDQRGGIQGGASLDWITGCAMDTLMMIIKPQLGHISSETSELYLVWLQRIFSLTVMQEAYAVALDELACGEVNCE